ncbi:MAG: hypothetical protein GX136_07140, partial [Clostridiales bacterium]|nr:hypothetical protein [Clostridiales bacterium]
GAACAACLTIILLSIAILPQAMNIWSGKLIVDSQYSNLPDQAGKKAENSKDSPPANETQKNNNGDNAPTTHKETQKTDKNETAVIPPWNELTITEKFRGINYNGIEYSSSSKDEINEKDIGKLLLNTTVTGYDNSLSEPKEYSIRCSIYALNKILPDCAIAVKFEGQDKYYPYLNVFYVPKTLGSFINDLNLRENLEFNNIIEYSFIQKNELITMKYTLPSTDNIWDMLLSDVNLKNAELENELELKDTGLDLMSCSINVKKIGIKNISLAVTENGYLTSNIFSSATFYIGKEKVDAFVDYVIKNGTGTVIARSDISNDTDSSETITSGSAPKTVNELG